MHDTVVITDTSCLIVLSKLGILDMAIDALEKHGFRISAKIREEILKSDNSINS